MRALVEDLRRHGIHVRTDAVTRALYATDASPYRIDPAGVVVARRREDLQAAVEAAARNGVPVTVRGAGTSLSGQSVGAGLQVDCSHLRTIERVDPEARTALVEPGVTWWQLNEALRPHGLEFGPDPATKRQATFGGMIGSNSGGTHSIVAGATVDHLLAADVVTADGARVRLSRSADGSVAGAGAPGPLAERLERVRAAAAPLIGERFASLARRGSGYQIERLCDARPDLAKLLAASDGTLAVVEAAEVSLLELPASRVLAVVSFDDMHAALAAVPTLVETGPCAVELVSRSMLDVARRDRIHAAAVAGIDPGCGAILFVEYQGGSEAEAAAGFARMDAALRGAPGLRERTTHTEPLECAARWAVREAGVGAMSAVASGPHLPQAFIEDTTVAVDRLPGYIRALEALLGSHGMTAIWYGHASTGLIHVRPYLDTTSARDLARLETVMAEVTDLVRDWGGNLCGEHGNGLSRTYWNERLFGPELYGQMRALKAAFDPAGTLNPGKVVDGEPPLQSLRYGGGYERRTLPLSIGFDDQGGVAAAAERCFGAGVCRKRETGTMCPPAAATGLEEHSTRARANLLRSVVSGALPAASLREAEAREVMETCVGCKACKSECPARVDVARLAAGWSDLVRRREGATPLQRATASLRTLSRMASVAPGLANLVAGSAALKQRLGVAPERELPRFASRPLSRWIPRSGGDVLLYADCFTTFQEPGIGVAAGRLLGATGARVALAGAGCCGRAMLSAGYADRARRAAKRAARRLRRSGAPIAFCEPSCLSMVVDDWPHLIGDVADIAARARLAEDLVAERGASLRFVAGGSAVLHPHCHQKALGWTAATERALALVPGLAVTVPDAGCCGMAGSFGYAAGRQDLSRAMAERVLAPAVRSAGDAAVLAPGTSCRHQIADVAGRSAEHPLEFLARRLLPGRLETNERQ